MSNWTPDQERAINESGQNIIVSAGAGSGKTAVLTERVITKLKKGTAINKLLVLTFTNAAANEMKDRIRKAIVDNNLSDQLDYLDSAYITTFDSYAASIVRKYHYLLNIPSKVQVVDDTIIAIETNRAIEEIFENNYGNFKFDKLISSFCVKDDKEIKDFIIDLNNKLDLKSDKDVYLDNYLLKYFNNEYINDTVFEYTEMVMKKVNHLKDLVEDIKFYLNDKQYEGLIAYLGILIDANNYDEIINLTESKSPIFRNLDQDVKFKYEEIKKIRKEIEKEIYTIDDLKNNILLTKDNVEVIISLVKELDKRLTILKRKNNSFTFNDIAKMAIKVVKDNEAVRSELQNYFDEIMVDEYQDTSDLQEEFLSLISNNNLYMVGDVKQSIYRFRHANPSIFKDKYNKYANNIGGIKIDLLKNFRSRSEVLNNINSIFDLIMDDDIGNADYSKSHRMVAGNAMYSLKANTNYDVDFLNYEITDEYKSYSKAEIEAFIIADDIINKVNSKYQVIDKKTQKLRDINYGDFCIIMDRGSSFDIYSKIFEYKGIPSVIWADEKLNVEDDIAILKNIINLIIKIKLSDFNQDFRYYFTSVARSYLFSYDDNRILDIFVNNKFVDDDIYKICLSISDQLDYITNTELLDMIIKEFNLYEKSIVKGNIAASMIRYDIFSNLFASLSNLGYTPYDLPDYFKNSKDLDIKYSLNSKVAGNVNIMNIHKSKGLEFSVCYYAGLSSKFNNSDIKNRFLYDDRYGIIIPFNKVGIDDTCLKTLAVNRYTLADISEKIRLFYVALTRAKEKMIIVSEAFDNDQEVGTIVDYESRLAYRSLYDILNSIKSALLPYIKLIDLSKIELSKDYNIGRGNHLPNIFSDDKQIECTEIRLNNEQIEDTHFSKAVSKIYSKAEKAKMDFGTYMHYLFEVTDFKNPMTDNIKVLNFISKLNLDNCKIYKEYEFIYILNNEEKHGVIDLMLEYPDHIDIYDYKLKNVDDEAYLIQLGGYKKYIEDKTKKPVNTYLYSILDEIITKI